MLILYSIALIKLAIHYAADERRMPSYGKATVFLSIDCLCPSLL